MMHFEEVVVTMHKLDFQRILPKILSSACRKREARVRPIKDISSTGSMNFQKAAMTSSDNT
jgi:hypothetical protein